MYCNQNAWNTRTMCSDVKMQKAIDIFAFISKLNICDYFLIFAYDENYEM